MKDKRYLLIRSGGMGDAMFLTPVCRWLSEHGHKIDVAISKHTAPLLYNNLHIDRIFESERFAPMGEVDRGIPANLIYENGAWIPDIALYDRYPSPIPGRRFDVSDYFRVIESCSLHPIISITMQSDYINTYDQHIAWAGIDPTRLSPEQRRPVYVVTREERKWAKNISKHWGKFVLIQTLASSPARSFMGVSGLVSICENAGKTAAYWNGAQWIVDNLAITFPEGIPTIRATAALIEQADLLVSSDTAVSHIAEAVLTKHLTFYTTVPAWTRSRDYIHEYTIDAEVILENGEPCKCCVIGRDCIRRSLESREILTNQEKELLALIPEQQRQQMGLHFIQPIKIKDKSPEEYFNAASPVALKALIDAAVSKWESQRQLPAYCLDSLHLDRELEKILEGGE